MLLAASPWRHTEILELVEEEAKNLRRVLFAVFHHASNMNHPAQFDHKFDFVMMAHDLASTERSIPMRFVDCNNMHHFFDVFADPEPYFGVDDELWRKASDTTRVRGVRERIGNRMTLYQHANGEKHVSVFDADLTRSSWTWSSRRLSLEPKLEPRSLLTSPTSCLQATTMSTMSSMRP